MTQRIFAICDTEEDYALRLTEYLHEKIRLPYAIHLFTETDSLQEFAAHRKIEILLIAESALKLLKEEYIRRQAEQIFVLKDTDTPLEENGRWLEENDKFSEKSDRPLTEDSALAEGNMHCISKFQSPDKIVAALTETMIDIPGWVSGTVAEHTAMKLIGVYSPVKRCLQTTFALTMGQILAKEHKTLYINFENYSGFGRMLQRDFSVDMADLMYYYRCAKEKLPLRLPSIIQNINGLDYIPPQQSHRGVREETGNQWLELCRYVAGIGQYEYVILDLDDGMEGLFDLLQSCCRIYTITKDDSFAVAKLEQYERMLKFNELEDISDKTVKCRFPVFKEIPVNLELMTHGEMAAYVKAIVNEDLNGK